MIESQVVYVAYAMAFRWIPLELQTVSFALPWLG